MKPKLTILIFAAIIITTVTCTPAIQDYFITLADEYELRESINDLRQAIITLDDRVSALEADYASHVHEIGTSEGLQEQFNKLADDLSEQIVAALELLKGANQ